jgi:hypothetical protein
MNICKEIERFALEREKFRQQKRREDKGVRSAFWPSEACVTIPGPISIGKCHRALWYSFKNEPVTNFMDGKGWRTVKAGVAFEDLMIETIKEMNMWDAKMNDIKKFYDEDLNISGEVDIFIKVDKKTIGIECKTIYGYWARKEVFTYRTPKTEHLMQTALYAYHFYPIPFKIIYGCRDTQEITEFSVELDSDKDLVKVDGEVFKKFPLTISAIRNKFSEFQSYLDKDEAPPRTYSVLGMTNEELKILKALGELNKTEQDALKNKKKIVKIPWQCSYCDYKDKCRIDAIKENGGKGRPDLLIIDEEKKQQNEQKEQKIEGSVRSKRSSSGKNE